MKKLFLYLAIIFIIFIIPYTCINAIFSNILSNKNSELISMECLDNNTSKNNNTLNKINNTLEKNTIEGKNIIQENNSNLENNSIKESNIKDNDIINNNNIKDNSIKDNNSIKRSNTTNNDNKPCNNDLPVTSYYSDNKKHKYIVTEENGLVIVYFDNKFNVFEYTDISMEELKHHNLTQYNKIINKVIFHNKEDIYRYLQSISS